MQNKSFQYEQIVYSNSNCVIQLKQSQLADDKQWTKVCVWPINGESLHH